MDKGVEVIDNTYNRDVKVSIICVSYNHKRYIAQALDSILKQKCNFVYEIIIHDDASTDGTIDIVRWYCKNYPDKVIAIIEDENCYQNGKNWSYVKI